MLIFVAAALCEPGITGCSHELPEGHFGCDPDVPSSCPKGFFCHKRGTTGQYLCYSDRANYCGDGTWGFAQGEQCDGADLGAFSCEEGIAFCDEDCRGQCSTCGDGIREGPVDAGEQCDGTDVGQATCESQGFASGPLGCTANCRFDYADCGDWCGDGVVQPEYEEVCDDARTPDQTCRDFGYFGGGMGCVECALDEGGCSDQATQWGGAQGDKATAVFGAADGGLYITGVTTSSLDGVIAPEACMWTGEGCPFVAKFDADANLVWVTQLTWRVEPTAIRVVDDRVLVTGVAFENLGGDDDSGGPFLAAFDSTGGDLWVEKWGNPSPAISEWATGLAVDSQGQTFVCGWTEDPSNTGYRGFFSALDASGQWQWTEQVASTDDSLINGCTVDATGNLWLAGSIRGELEPGAAQGGYDAFLMKVDGTGQTLWVRQLGSDLDERGTGVVTVSQNGAVIAGTWRGGYAQTPSVFLARYSDDGTQQWLRPHVTYTEETVAGVVEAPSGAYYVAGTTNGDLDGNSSRGMIDLFLMQFDAQGVHGQTYQWGAEDSEECAGLTVLSPQYVFVVGKSWGSFEGSPSSGYTGPGGSFNTDVAIARVPLAP